MSPSVAVGVRAMTDDDWGDVERIFAAGIATGDATFETDVPARATLDAAWIAGQRWVAQIDGTVVGWATLARVSSRRCYAGVAETSVYVDHGRRGRGVGRALLRHQVEAADAAGLWTLQAAVFPENTASIALFIAAGFRTVGVRERIAQRDGIWRDTVLMERRAPSY